MVLITSADKSLGTSYAWKEPDRLLEEAVMVAATRPGYDISNLALSQREVLSNFDQRSRTMSKGGASTATGIRRGMLTEGERCLGTGGGVRGELHEGRGGVQWRKRED